MRRSPEYQRTFSDSVKIENWLPNNEISDFIKLKPKDLINVNLNELLTKIKNNDLILLKDNDETFLLKISRISPNLDSQIWWIIYSLNGKYKWNVEVFIIVNSLYIKWFRIEWDYEKDIKNVSFTIDIEEPEIFMPKKFFDKLSWIKKSFWKFNFI